MFMRDRGSSTIDSVDDVVRHNSYRKNGPYMRPAKFISRSSFNSTKNTHKSKANTKSDEGGLLHRIVEDLKENRPLTSKKR